MLKIVLLDELSEDILKNLSKKLLYIIKIPVPDTISLYKSCIKTLEEYEEKLIHI